MRGLCRRLQDQHLLVQLALGTLTAAAALPWVVRWYGRYFETVAGRPCGAFLELLLPRVVG